MWQVTVWWTIKPCDFELMLLTLLNKVYLFFSDTDNSEIEKSIDHMNILRKDKWAVEGKIRKWV